MDLPTSQTSSISMSSDNVEAGGHVQPSTAALEQEMRPITSNMGMHIGIPIVSSGVASFVPAAQSVLSYPQSVAISMAPLMPLRESYTTPFTSATSTVYQNLTLEQFHIGQPVPALDRSSIPGTLMGRSGSSTIQDSLNRVAVPDISQPVTTMQQLGVNNNTTASMPQIQPTITATRSEPSVLYEGNLYLRREGEISFITRIEGFIVATRADMLYYNWPTGLGIVRSFRYDYNCYRSCIETDNFIVFRVMTENPYLRRLHEDNICSVVELRRQTLFLFVLSEVCLIGVVCSKNDSQLLEQLLRGVLQRSLSSQRLIISQLLQQGSSVSGIQAEQQARQRYNGEHMRGYHRQLSLFQRRIRSRDQQLSRQLSVSQQRTRSRNQQFENRQQSRELPELQRPAREGHNQLQEQHPSSADLGLQLRVQQEFPERLFQPLRNDPELQNDLEQLQFQSQQERPQQRQQAQQQRQQQEQVHQEQRERLQQRQQVQQQRQQQEQVHQEQQTGRVVQPTVITEMGWLSRVLHALMDST